MTSNSTSSQGIGSGTGSQSQSKYAAKSNVVQSITGIGGSQEPDTKKFADISGQIEVHGDAPLSKHNPPGVEPDDKHHSDPL